jgi:hypothetical protein
MMKKLFLLLFIVVFAGCGSGGGGGTGTANSQIPGGNSLTLSGVQGTFSTAQGEYPITTTARYSTYEYVNGIPVFDDISSVSMSLTNKSTGEEIPFTVKNIQNVPYDGPPLEWMDKNLLYKVLTVDFVAPQKPPIGVYTLHQYFIWHEYSWGENWVDYTVE